MNAAVALAEPQLSGVKRLDLADLEEVHLARARQDPADFAAYVLRDEETGMPIALTPMHREWHNLITRHKRTLLWAHIEAGKSQQVSIARVLFELGRNPNLRVMIVSNTNAQAQKLTTLIAKYIEKSDELHRVFPNLKPAKGMPWNTHQLFVERTSSAKDASVQTTGLYGSVLGARVDLLILDDVLDYENALSVAQREKLYGWYKSTLEGRLTRKGRVICVGTAWHRDDIMHRFAAMPAAWMAVRYPVMDAKGEPTWPNRWSKRRIEEKRVALGPVEFARQLECIARSDEEARFKMGWIERGLENGRKQGVGMVGGIGRVPDGWRIYTGVDLSVGKSVKGDLTVLFTIAVDPSDNRRVLRIKSGRWESDVIMQQIVDTYQKFGGVFFVEDNGAQDYILQIVRKISSVPVLPYHTGAKVHRHPELGIEAMAVEHANGKWIIPVEADGHPHPEVQAWINEMLYYDPKTHAGDRLMASWFAREGSEYQKPKARKMNLQRVLLSR